MPPFTRCGEKKLEELKGIGHDVWTFFFEIHVHPLLC